MCSNVRTYVNPLGRASSAITDTTAFPDCAAPSLPTCMASESTLCLGDDGRFQVEIDWRDFEGNTGVGREVQVPPGGLAKSDDSGLFFFFGEDNWELLIKVVDGCAFNDRFWVFAAATTDVEYRLTVTDNVTGAVKTYTNPLGTSAAALTDTIAFASCGMAP